MLVFELEAYIFFFSNDVLIGLGELFDTNSVTFLQCVTNIGHGQCYFDFTFIAIILH